ncbi:hypothetical protein [Arenibaculum sp.]|jgi:hypothetical protein|nr:hypothetical protein [Arenibaculum sp.]
MGYAFSARTAFETEQEKVHDKIQPVEGHLTEDEKVELEIE